MRSAKREAQMKRTKKPVPPPAAANSTGLTVTGGAHSNNWISASGETHGNGSSTSGGSLPRDPETARRDAKIVQEALDLRARNPDRKKVKDKTIISDVARRHSVGDSYVRRKLAEYRKKLGTDPNHPHKPTSWDEFHATVKPGHYFINPADMKLYQRRFS